MHRLICLTLALSSALANAAASDAPSEARVTSASAAGSGCPATAKIEAKLSDDLARLQLDLPAVKAELDTAKGKRLARVNCDVVVTIEHAPGFQLAPEGHAVELTGNVASGVEAKLAYRYHYQGQADTPSTELDYSKPGPVKPGTVTLAATPSFSPCGKSTTLVQSISLRIVDKGSKSPSTLELAPGSETKLVWRACK